jgi:hypothetical protein
MASNRVCKTCGGTGEVVNMKLGIITECTDCPVAERRNERETRLARKARGNQPPKAMSERKHRLVNVLYNANQNWEGDGTWYEYLADAVIAADLDQSRMEESED